MVEGTKTKVKLFNDIKLESKTRLIFIKADSNRLIHALFSCQGYYC